jgi:hypothetical protein
MKSAKQRLIDAGYQWIKPSNNAPGSARIRDIRAMAGRAMLDGPHDYKTDNLEGPLLDLAVAKAVGLKAVIHLVDNALAPFYECCVTAGFQPVLRCANCAKSATYKNRREQKSSPLYFPNYVGL